MITITPENIHEVQFSGWEAYTLPARNGKSKNTSMTGYEPFDVVFRIQAVPAADMLFKACTDAKTDWINNHRVKPGDNNTVAHRKDAILTKASKEGRVVVDFGSTGLGAASREEQALAWLRSLPRERREELLGNVSE